MLSVALLASLCFAPAAPSAPAGAAGRQQRLGEARALQQKGSLREAEKLYESLLGELESSGDQAGLGSALNSLSQIATAEGDYGGAAARARQAADVYRRSGDKNGETRALNNIGVAELYGGDYQPALAHFQVALALSRASGDVEGQVEELNNVGSAFYYQARYLDALREYRAAMELVEGTAGEPWNARRRRVTINNLAGLFQRLGQYEQALELYQQLQKSPEALAPSEQARLLTNVGVLYRRLDDPWKALETYEAAKRLFAREQHQDGQIGVLKNMGIVQALDLGDLPAALEAFTSALALAEGSHSRREAMQVHLYRGEALVRQGELDAARRDFEAALASANELGTTEEQWKALYGLGRIERRSGHEDLAAARYRQAIAGIESVRSRLQLSTLKADFLADKRDVYDALIELLSQHVETAEIFNLMERSRGRSFQDTLQERGAGPGAAPVLTPTLAAVQARLDGRTLLVEFWVGPQAAAVLWVTHDGSGMARFPFSAADVGELSSFVKELSSGSGEGWRRSSDFWGKRLLSGVVPLARPELQHLILVPDGPLSALPFEALRAGGEGAPLLIERFDVSYLPSAAILLRDPRTASTSWAFPWSRQLVAFGDPLVSRRPNEAISEALPGVELPGPLPISADEVRAIARMGKGRAELHLGAGDLKKFLLEGRARGVPLLHLSTHATADEVNPERSRILFSPEREMDRADYLFLKEVYDLDLRGVDLTTVSACDTERGKVIRGEGLQGFSRALLAAGSRATVTTLWRVADQHTAEFMRQFYFQLGQLEPKAQALRLAKLKLLRSGTALQHPRFWAAFVMNGDGLSPIVRVFSWSSLLAPAAAVLLVAGALFARRQQGTV